MLRFFLAVIFLGLIAVGAYSFFIAYQAPENPTQLILYGNVDVRQVDLGFRVSGKVDRLVFEEGDLVSQGKLIATLDKQPYLDQVKQAQASVDSIHDSLINAQQNLARREGLVSKGSVSQEDYDNSVSARNVLVANLKQAEAALGVALTNLKDTEIFAPNEGVILTRIREPGSVVKAADSVYTLSLTTPVWIRAYVAEPYLGVIYPGMTAEITTDTPKGTVYHGHIGFISPVAEFTPKTVETTQLRTDLVYRLRVIADNPDKGLRQGMPVTIKLNLPQQKKSGHE